MWDPEIEWVESRGQRFEVATAGDPESRRLALLLHGFPEHAISWRYQLPLFAERGFKVWAPNQRGYGGSSIPKGKACYQIDELVADVAGLIDAAACDEVILVGHDWGAIVAWEFASRETRPLEKLIILNVPHPQRFREELAHNKAQRKKSRYAGFFQLPWLPEWLLTRKEGAMIERAFRSSAVHPERFPDDVIEVYRRNVLRKGGATAMINWYRAIGGRFGDPVSYAPIATPTLMLWGEQDIALTKETTFGTERLVKDLTLRYLPDASHWVQQDAPDEVNAMIAAWLDGREVPGNTA